MASKRVNVWDAVITSKEDVERFVTMHLNKILQHPDIDPALFVIVVDLNRVGHLSSTGNSLVVANTSGFHEPIFQRDEEGFLVRRDEFFSLYVMRPLPEGAKKK